VQLADFVESQVVQVIQDLQALLPNELAWTVVVIPELKNNGAAIIKDESNLCLIFNIITPPEFTVLYCQRDFSLSEFGNLGMSIL
jgi:hypothetical protein